MPAFVACSTAWPGIERGDDRPGTEAVRRIGSGVSPRRRPSCQADAVLAVKPACLLALMISNLSLVADDASVPLPSPATADGQAMAMPTNLVPIKACAGKTEGSACSMNLNGSKFDGTCKTSAEGIMACVPGQFDAILGQAKSACGGKQVGAPCVLQIAGQRLTGTCKDAGGARVCDVHGLE